MAKGPRIKRGYSVFKSRRTPVQTVLTVLAAVLGAGLLTFLAVSVLRPLQDFVSSSSSESTTVVSRDPAVVVPSSSVSSNSSEFAAVEEEKPYPVSPGELKAAFLPSEMMIDSDRAGKYMKKLAEAGYNAVVILCKDENGYILYESRDSFVVQNNLVSPGGIGDLPFLCEKAHDFGLTAVAWVYGFQDAMAANVDADMAIHYETPDGVLWLDAALEDGGRPRVNPCSPSAQDYLCRILDEVTLYGSDMVLLEGMDFPTMTGSQFAWFTENDTEALRAETLSSFIERAVEVCSDNGAELIPVISAYSALGTELAGWGGVNPLTMSSDYWMVDLQLERFTEITWEGGTIPDPAASPKETLDFLISRLDASNGQGKVLLIRLQNYLVREDLKLDAFLAAQNSADNLEGLGRFDYEPNGLY